MLKINIICIGKIKEKYFSDAIAEYTKRLGAFCKFTIVELSEEKIRDNNPNQAQISDVLLAEGRSILKKISHTITSLEGSMADFCMIIIFQKLLKQLLQIL